MDSIFMLWTKPEKDELKKSNDTALLDQYIQFCCDTIDEYLIAVRKTLPAGKWTPDRKNGGLLTTTVMNSLLICLRSVIENGKTGDTAHYENKFAGLTPKSFEGFHSSQYGKLAERLFDKHFS